MIDFDAVYQALADRLQSLLGDVVVDVIRVDRPPIRCHAQPILLVLESDLAVEWKDDGLPGWWTLGADVVLYSHQKEGDSTPGKTILEVVSRIHDALSWQELAEPCGEGYSTTLGGLVRYARISGQIDITGMPENAVQLKTSIPVEMRLDPSE